LEVLQPHIFHHGNFFGVSDGRFIKLINVQLMCCIVRYNKQVCLMILVQWMQCQKRCITYFKTNGITSMKKHTMKKWGDLQLALQLIFWVVMNICNSFVIQHIFRGVMLLNKLHELQWVQLTICQTIYICKLCNSIITM
jgi:hypothetical protein